jgi:hypothetical protein
VDYFFEDYHFAVDLAVHADAISACIQIHDVKQARRVQTLSLKVEGTNVTQAREKVLLRMREWIRRRRPPRLMPTTVEELQALVQHKSELEEELYQELMDAEGEDYRIECFYRIQRMVETQTLLVARAFTLLPHRERDRFWELDPSLMAELMSYDIQSASDIEPVPHCNELAAPSHPAIFALPR